MLHRNMNNRLCLVLFSFPPPPPPPRRPTGKTKYIWLIKCVSGTKKCLSANWLPQPQENVPGWDGNNLHTCKNCVHNYNWHTYRPKGFTPKKGLKFSPKNIYPIKRVKNLPTKKGLKKCYPKKKFTPKKAERFTPQKIYPTLKILATLLCINFTLNKKKHFSYYLKREYVLGGYNINVPKTYKN